MKQINETMSIYEILNSYPYLLELFKQYGLDKFEKTEILEKLGPLLKLKTALSMVEINSNSFIDLLNNAIADNEKQLDFTLADSPERQNELSLLALLPCGMKMPFNRALDEFSLEYSKGHDAVIRSLVEGNVNHELSYYAYIDSVTSIDELPDIIISSDINSFYHRSFKERFLDEEYFVNVGAMPLNKDFESIGFADPRNQFTMVSANLLVLVTIDELMGDLDKPGSWGDVLDEKFTNQIVMRGQDGFFCNGVLLPFYAMFGSDGIRALSKSVYTGMHPSEMVNMIDSRKSDAKPCYIMPYFFAQKIKDKSRVTIHVPKEGAIVSPVQMLVKKSAQDEVKDITDFLCGKEFGELSAKAFFPTVHPEVSNNFPDITKLFWLGWDFLINNDMGVLKKEVEEVFLEHFAQSGGVV